MDKKTLRMQCYIAFRKSPWSGQQGDLKVGRNRYFLAWITGDPVAIFDMTIMAIAASHIVCWMSAAVAGTKLDS